MRHRIAGRTLHRDKDQRRALFRSLITELLRHERIETTEAKAKAVRADAEKMITLGKRGDVHARRLAAQTIIDPDVTKKLFEKLGPRYKERKGGYTRLFKVGPRLGDAAPVVIMELVDREA
ncbi:MAG: 50S ribosomal protein L17 [Chloroflexi bacterium]|nr:50S ribosomal protein L17 [Chloroflexota bacterium]